MTVNQTIGNYEIITDESDGEQMVFRHLETGNQFTLDATGAGADFTSDSIQTDSGITVTQDETLTYGRHHATSTGESTVIGIGARAQADTGATRGDNDPRTVVVGFEAGRNADKFALTASGYQAAKNNAGGRVTASGYRAAEDNTGDRVTASGYQAVEDNTGSLLTVSGYQAAESNTGNRVTASGYQAAKNNAGGRVTASGYRAAQDNTADNITASGYRTAQNNTGNSVTASGYLAAQTNTGNRVTVSGYLAAQNNTGNSVTVSGYQAAQGNTGNRVTASGYRAAQTNTGNRVTALGYVAAQGDGLADPTTMGDDNIGIGASAIRDNQASGLIAIGQEAGRDATTDDQLIVTDRNGTRRMVMDLTNGDLKIGGSLTENASL